MEENIVMPLCLMLGGCQDVKIGQEKERARIQRRWGGVFHSVEPYIVSLPCQGQQDSILRF